MWTLFVANRNISRFERLLVTCSDATQRRTLEELLAAERLKRLARLLPAPAGSNGARRSA